MPFTMSSPGVLELPDTVVQFFNLWDDPDSPGTRVVMVAIADDAVVELHAGESTRVGNLELTIDKLDDPETTPQPISGSFRLLLTP